jgi:hypothetical protein
MGFRMGITKSIMTQSIEDRITITRLSTVYLMKYGKFFPLPRIERPTLKKDKNNYIELATKIDNAMDKFASLITCDNAYIHGALMENRGIIHFLYENRDYNDAVNFGDPDTLTPEEIDKQSRWVETIESPELATITFNKNNQINATIKHPLLKIAKNKLVKETELNLNEKDFYSFIESTIETLDSLFIKEGFEPDAKKRVDLIGLAYDIPKQVIKHREIRKLLQTNVKNHTINNPNLIRLAAQGCSAHLFKLLYLYETYPKSIEDVLELANIPFDMLRSILAGREFN